jgi:hypothetical protein
MMILRKEFVELMIGSKDLGSLDRSIDRSIRNNKKMRLGFVWRQRQVVYRSLAVSQRQFRVRLLFFLWSVWKSDHAVF